MITSRTYHVIKAPPCATCPKYIYGATYIGAWRIMSPAVLLFFFSSNCYYFKIPELELDAGSSRVARGGFAREGF